MRIAIIGTRGIPNKYGEYEQYAEFLAKGLQASGHEVIVYNSHNHPWQRNNWEGIKIIHVQDPEYKWWVLGRFAYHMRCILDVRKHKCDFVYQMDYATTSIWGFLLPRHSKKVFYMDSLTHKKTKFGKLMSYYLPFAERLAVHYSDRLISDSDLVRQRVKQRYGKESIHIPYAADPYSGASQEVLHPYGVKAYQYNVLISKVMKEDGLELILDGVVESNNPTPFLIVTNHVNKYGLYLQEKYAKQNNIRFLGGVYERNKLNALRYYSNLCFYGNTTCSTNALLIEAMAAGAVIAANQNELNKSILGNDAVYFKTTADVVALLQNFNKCDQINQTFVANNLQKIKQTYNWKNVVGLYENNLMTDAKEINSRSFHSKN